MDNFKLEISDIIRKIRLEDGLTQKDLAERLGVSAIAIHSYEKKKRKPGLKFYQKLIKQYPELHDQLESFGLKRILKETGDIKVFKSLIKSQKETIKLQKEKIKLQKEKIKLQKEKIKLQKEKIQKLKKIGYLKP